MAMKEFDFSAKRVTASIDESLARMGIEYVDIFSHMTTIWRPGSGSE